MLLRGRCRCWGCRCRLDWRSRSWCRLHCGWCRSWGGGGRRRCRAAKPPERIAKDGQDDHHGYDDVDGTTIHLPTSPVSATVRKLGQMGPAVSFRRSRPASAAGSGGAGKLGPAGKGQSQHYSTTPIRTNSAIPLISTGRERTLPIDFRSGASNALDRLRNLGSCWRPQRGSNPCSSLERAISYRPGCPLVSVNILMIHKCSHF